MNQPLLTYVGRIWSLLDEISIMKLVVIGPGSKNSKSSTSSMGQHPGKSSSGYQRQTQNQSWPALIGQRKHGTALALVEPLIYQIYNISKAMHPAAVSFATPPLRGASAHACQCSQPTAPHGWSHVYGLILTQQAVSHLIISALKLICQERCKLSGT